jgi:hypothetical protein
MSEDMKKGRKLSSSSSGIMEGNKIEKKRDSKSFE